MADSDKGSMRSAALLAEADARDNELVRAEAVVKASELMNKHHDAIDTIVEALGCFQNNDAAGAHASLEAFNRRWDVMEEDHGGD